ncbi:MAG: tape measure protein [Actinobacteria bacterium]|nr:tape measure protein [Actinomycetota bacterium]
MAAVELATAYVQLLPSTRGIKKQLDRELSGPAAEAGQRAGERAGGRFSGAFTGIVSTALKVGGVAAAAAFGASLVKGFGRLKAIDDARFKLAGLGHDAAVVDAMMTDALASVKGTAFGLGEAASIAASTVAAGIKPGKELQRTLSLTADAASIAGISLGEMGSIFNKVAAGNRATMEEINQLADRGVPIIQWLADEFGVTALAVRDMVSDGEVDFATFQNAIEKNIGGAALKAGESFTGSLANMGAGLGRFGAIILGPAFEAAKGWFAGITDGLDLLAARIAPFVPVIADKLAGAFAVVTGWLGQFGGWWSEHGDAVIGMVITLGGAVGDVLVGAFDAVVGIWNSVVKPAFDAVMRSLTSTDGLLRRGLLVGFGLLVTALSGVGGALSAAGRWMTANKGVMQGIATFLAVVFVPHWIKLGIQAVVASLQVAAAWVASAAGGVAAAAATSLNIGKMIARWAWAGVKSLLHAAKVAAAWVVAMGPVGWVIATVVGLVALIVANWDKVVAFTRKAWTWVTDKLRSAWRIAVDVVKVGMRVVLASMTGGMSEVVLWVVRNWDRVTAAFRGARDRLVSIVTGIRDRVVGFFVSLRDRLVAIATAIRDRVVGFFTRLKELAVAKVTDLVTGVRTQFDRVVEFIKGMPGRIARVASGMWDGIKDAFRAAINWIIRAWNRLEFRIPGFDPPGPGPKFSGFTLGVPDIPLLDKGGVAMSPTLAMIAERRPEAVIPLDKAFPVAAPPQVPSTLVVVDADGTLIGRMRVEADRQLDTHDRRHALELRAS